MAGMLFKKAPFFKYIEGNELFHAAAQIFGLKALQEIDYKNKIPKSYVKEYGHITPTNLFDDFKNKGLCKSEDYDLYGEAFDVLG
jgi:hypothetical protein